MKRSDTPSREDDARMRRVMDRLRSLLEEITPRRPRSQSDTPRPAPVSGEIVV